MITTNDIKALIALAIQNNKNALIQAMNKSGYPVLYNISDDDLFTAVLNVFTSKGVIGLKSILDLVPLDTSVLTQDEAQNLVIKFQDVNPASPKLGSWFSDLGKNIGDLLSGYTTVTVDPTIITKKPSLSATQIIIIAVIAIAAIVILSIVFKKSL